MPLSEPELLKAFAGIRVWEQRGQRAPHKPLLALVMLVTHPSADRGQPASRRVPRVAWEPGLQNAAKGMRFCGLSSGWLV